MPSARLERSTKNSVIAGVCGGIAEYLVVDATLVRIVFVLGTLVTAGFGILAYIVLLLVMPLPGRAAPLPGIVGEAKGESLSAPSAGAPDAAQDPAAHAEAGQRRTMAVGLLLVLLGAIFFLGNLGAFRFVQFQLVWPLVLIALGVLVLAQRVRQ